MTYDITIVGTGPAGPGFAPDLLRRYQVRHMRKTTPMYYGTNQIVRFFTDDRMPVKFARQAALRLSNNFLPIKPAIRNMLTESVEYHHFLPTSHSRLMGFASRSVAQA